MARPSERDRYKYGICTNRDKNGEGTPCPKCESKEVQKVRGGQDFVCEECKDPLRMVPPPKEGPNMKMIGGIIAAVVVLGGVGLGIAFSGGEKASDPIGGIEPDSINVVNQPQEDDGVETDQSQTKEQVEVVVADKGNAGVTDGGTTGGIVTKDFGYAVYKGRMKNGLMNDENGVLTFKTTHVIEPRDVKKREAKAGEKVVGIFEDGHLITGTWYKSDGNKEVIIP